MSARNIIRPSIVVIPIHCQHCGVYFAMPETMSRRRRVYCPAGHLARPALPREERTGKALVSYVWRVLRRVAAGKLSTKKAARRLCWEFDIDPCELAGMLASARRRVTLADVHDLIGHFRIGETA